MFYDAIRQSFLLIITVWRLFMDLIKIKNAVSAALITLCFALPLCAAPATVVAAEGKVEVERGGNGFRLP